MIKIILAEDHRVVRSGIKLMLESENDFEIVGEGDNGLQVMDLLESGVHADIVLTDISMPEMDGLELSRNIRKKFPQVKVVVLSMMHHENYIFDAFECGIQAYLLKNTTSAEMKFAIRHVMAGKRMVCAELGMEMLKKAQRYYQEASVTSNIFTNRELEVLALIAEGYTNNEIADKVFTSRRTIEGHRQNLIDKAGVKNSAQLIAFASRAGLI